MWEHPDDPPELFDAAGQLKAGINYEDLKGVKARYNFLAGEKAHSWDENPMYTRFQFRLRTVLPPAWENNQYVDWDGYGRIREDEIGHDLNGDGDITDFAQSFYSHKHSDQADYGIPFARPSHGVVYDPRGMRFYMKRIKCLIGYRLNDPKTTLPKPVTNADPKRGIYSGSRHEFTFSVYNPDVRKK
jgi:hypothetical protein